MIVTVLAWVLITTCVVLAVVTILGTYRELDELRERLVTAEWRLGIDPNRPAPRVVGVGWTKRARRWLRRAAHIGGHRA